MSIKTLFRLFSRPTRARVRVWMGLMLFLSGVWVIPLAWLLHILSM